MASFAFLWLFGCSQIFLSQLILLVQEVMLAERPLNASCRRRLRLYLRSSLTRIPLRWRHLTAANDLEWGTFELWLRQCFRTCGHRSLWLRFVRLLLCHDSLRWRRFGSLLGIEMEEIGVFLSHFATLIIHILTKFDLKLKFFYVFLFLCIVLSILF